MNAPFSMPTPAGSNPPSKRPSLIARAGNSRPAWLVIGMAVVELVRALIDVYGSSPRQGVTVRDAVQQSAPAAKD